MGCQWGGGRRGDMRRSDLWTAGLAGALVGGLLTVAYTWAAGFLGSDTVTRVEVVTPGDVDQGEGDVLAECVIEMQVREKRVVVTKGQCDE